MIRSNCFVDLSTGVASVLLITAGAVVAADGTEAIVAVLLLPCCCGVAAAFGDPMASCALLLTCCGFCTCNVTAGLVFCCQFHPGCCSAILLWFW